MTEINYKARGELMAIAPVDSKGLYMIMSDLAGEYVVSLYRLGSTEWIDGHYFPTFAKARAYFTMSLVQYVPVLGIDPMWRSVDDVHKLSRLLSKLELGAKV